MNASLELSKELYKLSGWIDPDQEGYMYTPDAPYYDCGYLLRKLPNPKQGDGNPFSMELYTDGRWKAGYFSVQSTGPYVVADTPENALCKLAIELIKQGVIKVEGKNFKKAFEIEEDLTDKYFLHMDDWSTERQFIIWVEDFLGESGSADMATAGMMRDEDGNSLPLEDYLLMREA